jgi:hypothetical protein
MYTYGGKQIDEEEARKLIRGTLADTPMREDAIDAYLASLREYGRLSVAGQPLDYFLDDSAIVATNPGGSGMTFTGPDHATQRAASERRMRFYGANLDRIVRVAAALVSSPKFALNLDTKGRDVMVSEAAAIVSEIVRRAGYPNHLKEDDPEMR